jgi:hypothetical protein
MRAPPLSIALLVAAAVAAGCGGDDSPSSQSAADPQPGSAQRDVRGAIQQYVKALSGPDPGQACAVLTDRAKGALRDFLPSNDRSADCDEVAKRVARRSVALRRVKVSQVAVRGQTATARIVSRKPAYESAVLLSNEDGGWKINYPPGLLEEFTTPPGVPLHDDEPGG